jgi:predicted Ser/Thr protein kinase
MLNIDAARWRQIQPILDRALELSPHERSSWLDTACVGEPALRADIEQLLLADAETGLLDASPLTFLQLAADRRDRVMDVRFLPGVVLSGRYRIVSLLGRGGMGEVYRADDLKLGQPIALKFLPSRMREQPELLDRLLKEARIARQVSHPNVCRVYDVGDADGRTFITMEYVDGEDLRSLIDRIGQLSPRKALDIARQLSAGLQAAHDLGILHRDLKPANVMLDARGRVRITDFGLAMAMSDVGAGAGDVHSGTPAYMAPEQLEGRDPTAQSDIFALGLVMYELFTGMRAFQRGSIDDLRRAYEESRPTKPTAVVPDLNAAIERTILACLESDPTLRPPTARAVATALPGGDPIDVALEAGETPLPELVAASGPEGSLEPAWAFGTLVATLAMLVVVMFLADRASVLGWLQWPHSAAALEDHAREILRRVGYEAPRIDHAAGFRAFNPAYRSHVRAADQSARRWDALKQPGQWDAFFYYRQAPTVLMPLNSDGHVYSNDPWAQTGDVQLSTDLRGRLILLLITPELAGPPGESHLPPDWHVLFAEADLDPAAFQSIEPTRNPPVSADARAAWTGVASGWGNVPVHVEAAAYRGRPVYFELIVPWDPYWDPAKLRAAPPYSAYNNPPFWVISLLTFIAMPAVVVVLVARNWFNGRGDRQGAIRLAAIVFCVRLAIWVVGGHHVASLFTEWLQFSIAIGKSLADAAATWVLYLALESSARRLHPRFLVSWNRLLRGRHRDPLVGRDILAGVALAMIITPFWLQLPILIPHWLGTAAPPPPMFFPLGGLPFLVFLNPPLPLALLGGRFALEALADSLLAGFGLTVTWIILLLGLHLLLRRLWAALIVFGALMLIVTPTTEMVSYSTITLLCSLIFVLTWFWGFRFGLVGTLAMWVSVLTLANFPITARVDLPHFGIGLVGVAAVAALATYGAFTASRRPVTAPALRS